MNAAIHPAISAETARASFDRMIDPYRAIQAQLRALEQLAAASFERGDMGEVEMFDAKAERLEKKLRRMDAVAGMLFPKGDD